MTQRPDRNRFERALQELQITLNIARRNSLEDENDTWVLFSDQYLDVVRAEEVSPRDRQFSKEDREAAEPQPKQRKSHAKTPRRKG